MRGVREALILSFVFASPAWAQQQTEADGPDPLEQAEEAYLEVDFDNTFRLSMEALEAGGNSRARMVRIYRLIGISAAALDRAEESRDAYVRMLALDPQIQVDRNLAPRLRGPFLEARGFWTARTTQFETNIALLRQRGALRIRLSDPVQMAETIVLHYRLRGEPLFLDENRLAAREILVEGPGLSEADVVEYYLEVLDTHGNQIIELGEQDLPLTVGQATGPVTPPGGDDDDGIFASPWFWMAAGAAVLIGGGVTAYFLFVDQPVTLQSSVTFQ
jgi:hypothetical protein